MEEIDKDVDLAQVAQALELAAEDLIFAKDKAEVLRKLTQQGVSRSIAEVVAEAGFAHPLARHGRIAATRARKCHWLLEVMERHQTLRPGGGDIPRRHRLSGEAFLQQHYATGRPVILTGCMEDWPAVSRWTPEYLKQTLGDVKIQYQGERDRNKRYEMQVDAHRREIAFSDYMDLIAQPGVGNQAYITANNSAHNARALAPLHADLGFPGEFLEPAADVKNGMMWIGPAGTVTSLHHDLTDNLVAQVVGRKRFRLFAAADVGKLYNHHHVFSEIVDLDDPDLDMARLPLMKEANVHDITLLPGEMLFIPIGWWHQVNALDFSVTITYTNFRWRNDWYQTYPGD